MGTRISHPWAAVFLVPFVAASLTLTPATVPAAHAALTPVAASAGCPAAEIIGVHGTSEGPSSTDSTDSPEIKATFAAFAADEHKLGEHGARLEYYPYPTVTFAGYLPVNWPALRTTIDDYAGELEAELESFSHSCPDTPISLVGYSLGALLINNMLSLLQQRVELHQRGRVVRRPVPVQPERGLPGPGPVRRDRGAPAGLLPGERLPVPAGIPGRLPLRGAEPVHQRDPVCGQGWPPYEIGGQIIGRGPMRPGQVPAPVLLRRSRQRRCRVPSR